jgi:hypothetical protein
MYGEPTFFLCQNLSVPKRSKKKSVSHFIPRYSFVIISLEHDSFTMNLIVLAAFLLFAEDEDDGDRRSWHHREDRVEFVPLSGVKIDFRVWLCQPRLCLPSEYREPLAPSLLITSDTGLWYGYKSIETLSPQ